VDISIMRNFPARLLVVGGLIVILFGFVYGLIFAGIGYQDPTPEMSANYAFHFSVSSIILVIGFGSMFLGIVCAVANFIFKKLSKTEG
jgi:ABC-type antimicrobial peptide transport system permease subunit